VSYGLTNLHAAVSLSSQCQRSTSNISTFVRLREPIKTRYHVKLRRNLTSSFHVVRYFTKVAVDIRDWGQLLSVSKHFSVSPWHVFMACYKISDQLISFCTDIQTNTHRFVLVWVTVSGFNSRCETFISVCDQPPRSTQPGHPFVGRLNTVSISQRAVTPCGWGVLDCCVCVFSFFSCTFFVILYSSTAWSVK